MDGIEINRHEEFRALVQRSFAGADAALVLAAHKCLVERLEADQIRQISAADMLLHHHAEPVVVAAALLVPLRRCRRIEPDELGSLFGQDAASLVEKIVHEDGLPADTDAHSKEQLHSFLQSNAEDPRLAILRIGLRLAELEKPADQSDHRRRDMAQETLELYVPLADQMGMREFCMRLEDVCFRVLEPSVYEELARNVEPIQGEDAICLELLEEGVRRLLEQNGVDATVYGRTKGLYSLYRKMCRRERPVQDIMDKIGLRIIVSSVGECYTALGLLHTHFRPIPGTFDDYIGLPKDNGYQALHTCIYPVAGISYKPVEIQIQTELMHQLAQFGIAAHWRYKGDEAKLVHERQVQWLHSLLSQHERSVNHAEFIERLRRQVFDNKLVIFGPGARQTRLPQGALVRDLVERFVENGEEDHVPQVNGVIRPLDYPLQDGDTVELVKAQAIREAAWREAKQGTLHALQHGISESYCAEESKYHGGK